MGIGFPDNELPGHFNKPCLKWPGEAPGHGVPVDAGGNEVAPPVLDEQFQWQIQKLQEWINRINVAAGVDAGKVKVDAADALAFLEDQFTDKKADGTKDDTDDLPIFVDNDAGADNKLEFYVDSSASMQNGGDGYADGAIQFAGHQVNGGWSWNTTIFTIADDDGDPHPIEARSTLTFSEDHEEDIDGVLVDVTDNVVTIKHANSSGQADVTASGGTHIAGVDLDTYGHVVGLTTGAHGYDWIAAGDIGSTTISDGETVNFVGTNPIDTVVAGAAPNTVTISLDLVGSSAGYESANDIPVSYEITGAGQLQFYIDSAYLEDC